MKGEAFAEVKAITFAYPRQPPLFEGFSWKIERGEAWAVIGPSGCGKTTLLYLLAGLLRPQKGEILVGGNPLRRPRPETALILQDYGLLPWDTVRGNIALGLRIRAFYGPDGLHAPRTSPPKEPDTLVEFWLRRLGLQDVADRFPSQISGGQRQRTAIARALVLRPDLLLMDEPFSSLDAPTREDLENLTLELQAETSLTIVVVTHSIEEAAFLGRKILFLGRPPHSEAIIVEGPGPDRSSPEYFRVCSMLREMLNRIRRS